MTALLGAGSTSSTAIRSGWADGGSEFSAWTRPETHPSRCAQEAQLGLAATQKLTQLLGSGKVTMSGSGHDQYGRELRQVFVNDVDVADSMIGAGLARSYDGGKRQLWC